MRNRELLKMEAEVIAVGLKRLERELHGEKLTQVQLKGMQREIQVGCVANAIRMGRSRGLRRAQTVPGYP